MAERQFPNLETALAAYRNLMEQSFKGEEDLDIEIGEVSQAIADLNGTDIDIYRQHMLATSDPRQRQRTLDYLVVQTGSQGSIDEQERYIQGLKALRDEFNLEG